MSIGGETYPQRTIPTNDAPEILEEPSLCFSDFFSHEIPLVSLKVLTFGVIYTWDPGEKGARLTYRKPRTDLLALGYP